MLAMSETREALNAILAVPVADRTDEQTADRDRLTKEIQELEPEFRAALASEDWGRQERTETVDAEERERRELRSKVSLSGYVKAAAARTLPDAEYREYNAAVGAEPNEVPLDLLGQVERRAVTPGPTDDATDAIAPYVFERTICEQLAPGCIRMTPTGPCFSVTMTTAPAAAATVLAKDADAVATAGAFTLAERRPVRLPAQGEFRIEDAAVLDGMEDAIRMSLTDLIGSAIDEVTINGKAASPDFDGLFDIASDVARPGADQAFAAAKSEFVGKVDGRYAYSAMDLRAAIGSLSYGKMEGLYQSSGDYSVYDVLMKKLGALVISDRMPAATNSNTSQKGLIVLSAGGGPPRIEVPVWNRLQLIRDEYTAAKKGQIVLTVNALIGAPVVRYGTDVLKELHFRFA
jgi:hypothetical protein